MPVNDLPGENSSVIGYVTLEEANTYIREHYMYTETARQNWEVLIDEDKTALLNRSFQVIELIPYTGRKTCCTQPNAFPRWPDETVPEAVKAAQIEQALTGADPEAAEDAKQYEKMWQWGVASYSIGNLSESLSEGTYGVGILRTSGITSAIASKLLMRYIRGGFDIK